MAKTKQYILWDLDGTMWMYKEHKEVEEIAKAAGIPYTETLEKQFLNMIEEFNRIFAKKIVVRTEIYKLIEETMPELYFRNVSGKQFLEAWCDADTTTLEEDAKHVLKTLHEHGKQNIVLTDWLLDRQVRLMKKHKIFNYIDKIYSCENNYMKNNPVSKARVGILEGYEDEYIIIGDSLYTDIAFATMAGIDSIWYNPKNKKNGTEMVPTYEITSLLDVLKIVL